MSAFQNSGNKKIIVTIMVIFALLLCISITLQSVGNTKYFITELIYLSSPYQDLKGIAKAAVYLVSYAISTGLLLIVIIQRSVIVWLIFLGYVLLTYFIDIASQLIGSRGGFTHFQYELFLNEAGNYKNLLIFLSEITKALLITGILCVVLMLIRRQIKQQISPRWLFLAPVIFFPVVVAKAGVHYVTYTSYPSPVKIPIIIANYHLKKHDQPPRVLSSEIVAGNVQTENIVLIIDESISGSFLSINGYNQPTTPDLEEFVKTGIVTNYGVTNSVANCSAFSQLGLRIGLGPDTDGAEANYIVTRRSLPTIYQFAKRAGYETWLIDAQVKEGTLTNYLTYDDLKSVDHYFTNSSRIEDYKRDLVALEKITDVMTGKGGGKKFIVFVKDGAHWPYLWRFPKSSTIFQPIQGAEYEPMIKENKEKVINTYMNLIRYTVNDFLIKYLSQIQVPNLVTFYTSDHGQAFMEDGAKDNLTHCSSYYDPSSSQVAVPLLVIESRSNKIYVPKAHMTYSQIQIFPSLLMEMGYPDEIVKRYGNTLVNGYPEGAKRWFYWSLEGDRSLYKPNEVLSVRLGEK